MFSILLRSKFNNLALSNFNFLWCSSSGASNSFNSFNNIKPSWHLSEDNMSAIEPLGFSNSDKKLTAIGILSSIGHGETERLMFKFKILIFKTLTPNWSTSGTITTCEITTLDHEFGNHSVEFTSGVGQFLIVFDNVTLTKCYEILYCFRNLVPEHVYLDVSSRFVSNCYWHYHLVGGGQLT